MSGHSKWATIKRSKAANDAKRGKLFTKLGHEIALAAREGGPDPEINFRLRLVLDNARRANMPKENTERAIARGAGTGGEGAALEELTYEGYGPSGIAILVEVLTDNRNRTVSDVRHAFARHGGNLGEDGCVAWMFSHKGYIALQPGDTDPEEVALEAIDAGAEDVAFGELMVEVYTQLEDFKKVQSAMEASDYEVIEAQLSWEPQSTLNLDEKGTLKVMKLIEALEDLDDVQQVHSNIAIADELIEKFESAAA